MTGLTIPMSYLDSKKEIGHLNVNIQEGCHYYGARKTTCFCDNVKSGGGENKILPLAQCRKRTPNTSSRNQDASRVSGDVGRNTNSAYAGGRNGNTVPQYGNTRTGNIAPRSGTSASRGNSGSQNGNTPCTDPAGCYSRVIEELNHRNDDLREGCRYYGARKTKCFCDDIKSAGGENPLLPLSQCRKRTNNLQNQRNNANVGRNSNTASRQNSNSAPRYGNTPTGNASPRTPLSRNGNSASRNGNSASRNGNTGSGNGRRNGYQGVIDELNARNDDLKEGCRYFGARKTKCFCDDVKKGGENILLPLSRCRKNTSNQRTPGK